MLCLDVFCDVVCLCDFSVFGQTPSCQESFLSLQDGLILHAAEVWHAAQSREGQRNAAVKRFSYGR